MRAAELSTTAQTYVMAIRSATCDGQGPVPTGVLAQKLGSSPSTVSETVRKLVGQGLVEHVKYGGITLTDLGQQCALNMVRRHRILETFLVESLGYTWDQVHDEADVLEHAVSDRLVDALEAFLGHPTRDPHGDPIPDRSGEERRVHGTRIGQCEPGYRGSVVRVSDADPEILRYLNVLGLALDSVVEVLDRRDSVGTVLVSIDGTEAEIGIPAANAVWLAGDMDFVT